MPRTSSKRLLLALALSLGVHAAVWLLLEARGRLSSERLGAPSRAASATLEFVEVEVKTPPAPPKPPPSPPKPPSLQERPRPPRLAAPNAPVTAPPPAAVAQVPPPSDAPARDVPRLDVPLAAGGTLAIPERLLSTSVPKPPLGLEARVEDPRKPPPPEKVVSDLVSESLGRGKVERGLVHPYFSTLGKSLLKQWDAERAVSSQGLSGFLEQARGNSQAWTRIWSERAAAYGATGSALASDTPRQAQRRPSMGDPNLDARRELRKEMREQFSATRRAVIRVVQDAQGRLVSAELVIPSNNAQVDREALADVRAAAERLPPPPPEAVGGKATLTSLWQFELIISISPPVPSLSFEFDEALGFFDARMPLDRRIYKRVRLLEVN